MKDLAASRVTLRKNRLVQVNRASYCACLRTYVIKRAYEIQRNRRSPAPTARHLFQRNPGHPFTLLLPSLTPSLSLTHSLRPQPVPLFLVSTHRKFIPAPLTIGPCINKDRMLLYLFRPSTNRCAVREATF